MDYDNDMFTQNNINICIYLFIVDFGFGFHNKIN